MMLSPHALKRMVLATALALPALPAHAAVEIGSMKSADGAIPGKSGGSA